MLVSTKVVLIVESPSSTWISTHSAGLPQDLTKQRATTPAGRVARRPSRPEPPTPVPRRAAKGRAGGRGNPTSRRIATVRLRRERRPARRRVRLAEPPQTDWKNSAVFGAGVAGAGLGSGVHAGDHGPAAGYFARRRLQADSDSADPRRPSALPAGTVETQSAKLPGTRRAMDAGTRPAGPAAGSSELPVILGGGYPASHVISYYQTT